jgi:cytosine/adenosine deaminase-related metal-dependent hydrolase/SAM-dependent methyltransferase
MASPSPTPCLSPAEGYRLWAGSYDRDANPMLSLEQSMLALLLPPVADRDVVDLGCGTGRWLHVLKSAGARSLLGIDPSPEMLSLAKAKLSGAARLLCTDYSTAEISGASADLILCNFVLSYIAESQPFLEFVRNTLRPGGSLLLTDVHPETAATLNWRRGVRLENEFREIRTFHRSIVDIIAQCREVGLALRLHLEPKFGRQEKLIFDRNRKPDYFNEIRELPAIYLLQFTAPEKARRSMPQTAQPQTLNRLHGARLALGPDEGVAAELHIQDSRVATICGPTCAVHLAPAAQPAVDLQGYLLLPGLINAHDHLEFALFPRLGKGGYQNFMDWAEDIHHSHAAEIARHRQVPKRVRLWWGGIRNILSGVTTVCHHNPYEPEVFSDNFVVRVLKDYHWAHSLQLDPGAASKKKLSRKGQPFLIHLAEGIDAQSADEVFELHKAGALDSDTVVIHGLGLGPQGSDLLSAAGAGLVWCPSSNLFLFGKALLPAEIRRFPRIAMGSDSPLTAQGDLLDEINCAGHRMQTPAGELYSYVTHQPAGILGLRNGEGSLRIGSVADLIAVRDTGVTPAETLSAISYRDVELVLLAGRVQLASTEMTQRLPRATCEGLQPLAIEGIVRWVRAPLDSLFAETQTHLGSHIFVGGKQVRLAG